MTESFSRLSSVLTRLQRAQDTNLIPRTDQQIYDQTIGSAYGRMERMYTDPAKIELKELQRLYGSQIEKLQPPKGSEEHATPLFETLFDHVFDSGANRSVSCKIPGEEETYAEGPAPVLSRASLIDRTLEKMRGDSAPVQIGLIDLRDLRSADFSIEGQEYKPADVIINKAAKAIRKGLEDAVRDPEIGLATVQSFSYELGRYGGDEFIFALFGEVSERQRTQILQKVQNSLSNERGYYERHDGEKSFIESDTLRLKASATGEKVEWIAFPSDPTEKKVFTEYFQRGLLLKPDEFEHVIQKYRDEKGVFNMEKYRADYPETVSLYPENVRSLEDKMKYIREHHPEFSMYFDLARVYDVEDQKGTQTRQDIILRTIERSIFDPLLGEAIYSRFDFQDHFNRNEFSDVFVFDLKFMKEINEGMTYADADMAIMNFWKTIRGAIQTPQERSKFYISRIGGTFLIGVKRGVQTDTQAIARIQKLLHKPVSLYKDESGADVQVPIGSSEWHVEKNTRIPTYLRRTDGIMFHNLFNEFVDQEAAHPGFMEKIMQYDLQTPHDNHHPMSHVELYARFLKGKRTLERVSALRSEMKKPYGVALEYSKLTTTQIERVKKVVRRAIDQLYANTIK